MTASHLYFDYNATAPVRPEVLEALIPFLGERFGNPSSLHWAGRAARKALDDARERVAALLGVRPGEVLFTSGGTESNNLAIFGAAEARRERGDHIVTSQTEHSSVLAACRVLERRGFRVTYLPVDHQGCLDLDALRAAITDQTILLSFVVANNETGTLFPVTEIGALARARGVLFHADGVQAAGKIALRPAELGVDLCSLSGHKLGGPKGTGVLIVRTGLKLQPLLVGGHQERNRRAGTENVPGIVGIGRACELAAAGLAAGASLRLLRLRDRLERGILTRIPGVRLNGHPTLRVPNTVNVSVEGVEGETLVLSLDLEGIAASSGSACFSGATEPSHVLLAMHVPRPLAMAAVRFSLGWATTKAETDALLERLPPLVERARAVGPPRSTMSRRLTTPVPV